LAYFQRASMLIEFISTTTKQYYTPAMVLVRQAARQGPALGVIPVFMPDQPYHSSLLVFYHYRW
jgi:hypothetical protein